MKRVGLLAIVLACGPRRAPMENGPPPPPPSSPDAAAPVPTSTRRAECTLAAAGCHDNRECRPSGLCESAPPSSDPGCGIPPTRTEACAKDGDCKSGEVCNAFVFGCEVGHRCEPRCQASGCADGMACGADGRCAWRRCPDDWSCDDYGACQPTGGGDAHGCVPDACTTDAQCPCAHCVSGRCSPIAGRCIYPRG